MAHAKNGFSGVHPDLTGPIEHRRNPCCRRDLARLPRAMYDIHPFHHSEYGLKGQESVPPSHGRWSPWLRWGVCGFVGHSWDWTPDELEKTYREGSMINIHEVQLLF